jgi:2-polyprenyl-3-methyl-5-hydroxy-6-metoxy-1,4-benzoquinol methylase
VREQLRRIPVVGPVARTIQRALGNSDWLDGLSAEVDGLRVELRQLWSRTELLLAAERVEQGAAGMLEQHVADLEKRVEPMRGQLAEIMARLPARGTGTSTGDAALAAALVSLADMTTAWSANYTKPLDEAYVQENQRNHQRLFDVIEELAQRAAPGRPPRLLEVGMGLGAMCIALSRHNYEVTGIDQDALQVARAKQLSREIGGFARYLSMDVFDMGLFREDSFDVAFSQGTMEHFGPAEMARALAEQLRVAPCVVFSVPSVDWRYARVGDERRMTTDEWRVALAACGLEPIVLEYYGEGRAHALVATGRPGA